MFLVRCFIYQTCTHECTYNHATLQKISSQLLCNQKCQTETWNYIAWHAILQGPFPHVLRCFESHRYLELVPWQLMAPLWHPSWHRGTSWQRWPHEKRSQNEILPKLKFLHVFWVFFCKCKDDLSKTLRLGGILDPYHFWSIFDWLESCASTPPFATSVRGLQTARWWFARMRDTMFTREAWHFPFHQKKRRGKIIGVYIYIYIKS